MSPNGYVLRWKKNRRVGGTGIVWHLQRWPGSPWEQNSNKRTRSMKISQLTRTGRESNIRTTMGFFGHIPMHRRLPAMESLCHAVMTKSGAQLGDYNVRGFKYAIPMVTFR